MTDYTEPRIGTVGFDGPPGRTWAKLNLVEYQESFTGTPSTKTLRRLGRDAGGSFTYVLRASAAVTHGGDALMGRLKLSYLADAPLPTAPFDVGAGGTAAWQWTLKVAQALGAEAIYWQTPAGFRPTPANRTRLAEFVKRSFNEDTPPVIWDSQGLWELDELAAVSKDLGLVPCYDPLLEERPLPGKSYIRVLGKARSTHGLSADELYLLADAVEASETPRVALHTPSPFRDARALVQILTGG